MTTTLDRLPWPARDRILRQQRAAHTRALLAAEPAEQPPTWDLFREYPAAERVAVERDGDGWAIRNGWSGAWSRDGGAVLALWLAVTP